MYLHFSWYRWDEKISWKTGVCGMIILKLTLKITYEGMNWVEMTRDMVQWWDVNAATNLVVLLKARNFLITFSRRIPSHGVCYTVVQCNPRCNDAQIRLSHVWLPDCSDVLFLCFCLSLWLTSVHPCSDSVIIAVTPYSGFHGSIYPMLNFV
jgi:hypothetical protein